MSQTFADSEINLENYLFLARKIAYKFLRKRKSEPVEDSDFYAIACEEMVAAAKKFHLEKGDFARFAWRAMRNGILEKLRADARIKRGCEIKHLSLSDINYQITNKNNSQLVDFDILPNLLQKTEVDTDEDVQDKKILSDHFIKGEKISSIATKLGISRVMVYNRINRIKLKLKTRFSDC